MQILFLCPHGGAKSVIAAAYFNRLAQQRGLPYTAIAAAAEDPYAEVPEPIVELLRRDGFDVGAFQPRHVEEDDLRGATKVIGIDCALTDCATEGEQTKVIGIDCALTDCATEGEQWMDVPKASDDLEGSAAAIRRHVEALAEELRGGR